MYKLICCSQQPLLIENNTSFCPFKRMGVQMLKNPRNRLFPFRHVNPSNTSMPWPTPLTMPNDISIGSRTVTHQCNKGPICYNGMHRIHPHNCPVPFDDHQPHLIHSSLDRPHCIQIQSAVLPQYTFQTNRQTDRQTNRQMG